MNNRAASAVPKAIGRTFEYALLGMLTAGYLAVLGSRLLDWPATLFGGAGLILRALMTAGVVHFVLPSRVTGALALLYLGFFPIDWYYLSGSFLLATVHMVFFLAVLKLITAKTARDFGYLKVIAGLELIAAAILSGGASFLIYLSIFVFFAIVAFASGEVYRGAADSATISRAGLPSFSLRLGWLSGFLFLGILLLTAAMFLILPRTARAAFARLGPPRARLMGFSNSVRLGEIGELKRNNTPVLHVRSYQNEGFLPVKWRGSALSKFDGTSWSNPEPDQLVRVDTGVIALRNAVIGTRLGRNLIYQARLSPLISDTLFFAGNPETIRIDVPFLRYSRGGVFHVPPRFGARGLNYSVYGFLPDEWAEVRFTTAPLAGPFRQELLSLPALDPRIPQLARDMTAGASTEVEQARALESHLRHDYGYTLELLAKPVADPLSYFLFERKKGHCEYFASAMAVMLRTIGIPSRVITGFQSGTYNSMTGWQVVRESDAHSWVEAWLDGRGWTTFDPTPVESLGGRTGFIVEASYAIRRRRSGVAGLGGQLRRGPADRAVHANARTGAAIPIPTVRTNHRRVQQFRGVLKTLGAPPRWNYRVARVVDLRGPLGTAIMAAESPRAQTGARRNAAFGRDDSVSALFAAARETRRAQASVAHSGGVRAGAQEAGSRGAGRAGDRGLQRSALRGPRGSRVAPDAGPR